MLACELINHAKWDAFSLHINKFARKIKWDLKWIGIEINPKYCEIARRRLAPYVTQRKLEEYV